MSARTNPHTGEKLSETLARFLVEQVTGVRVCCYDYRRGESRPDAIVHRHGGVPLEIVSDPSKADLKSASALDKTGRTVDFPGLRLGYMVGLTTSAWISDLTWLRDVLLKYENPATKHDVASSTDDYTFLEPVNELPPGVVRLSLGGGGGRQDPRLSEVVAEVSAILDRSADVARKLNAYGGVEQHVFLFVDEAKTPTFSWLRTAAAEAVGHLPAPRLPKGITHLWVAPGSPPRHPGRLALMCWSDSAWQGTSWRWGPPEQVVDWWDDPACSEHHGSCSE